MTVFRDDTERPVSLLIGGNPPRHEQAPPCRAVMEQGVPISSLAQRLAVSIPSARLHWSHVGDSGQTSANRGYAVRGNGGILVKTHTEEITDFR